MMAGFFVTEDDDMLHTQHIEEEMGSNRHLVIVVDADSNKKLDLQKVRFPTGIVVLITTEPSTQAEKDDDFRITCGMDLNISTQDHLLSWEVFCSYVRLGTLLAHSSMDIERIAAQIVKKCHGHLLAIVLLAKNLKNVEDVKQWELALDKLSIPNPFYDYQGSDRIGPIGISRVMVNAFVHIIWEDIDDTRKLCLELSLFVHNIKIGVRDAILVSDWGVSSSTRLLAKSSLETPVLSPLAPVSLLGSSKGETQNQKAVTKSKEVQAGSMIKKKVVLKVEVPDGKIKIKAIEAVADLSGVDSVFLDAKDQKLTVCGTMDPVRLVGKLRKLCHSEILSVGPAKEEKLDIIKEDEKKKPDIIDAFSGEEEKKFLNFKNLSNLVE
ncbi:Disease resistance protein [Spatholobus suberectus]|nr:Disease resistance protein [Spatholobus suberectus]